jgi:hypothetical protein
VAERILHDLAAPLIPRLGVTRVADQIRRDLRRYAAGGWRFGARLDEHQDRRRPVSAPISTPVPTVLVRPLRKRVHNAGCLPFEAVVTYPFHPLARQTVLVVGGIEHGGARHLIGSDFPATGPAYVGSASNTYRILCTAAKIHGGEASYA